MRDILIIKTSALGDIIQAFDVLDDFAPEEQVDWLVEERFRDLVAAHPRIRRVISFSRSWKGFRNALHDLRAISYDAAFDLQGNCKSGLGTFLCRAREKVGFGYRTASEWPNCLVTHKRFNVSQSINMRLQYRRMIQQYFQRPFDDTPSLPISLRLTHEEQMKFDRIRQQARGPRIMICPGARWKNKQLPLATWEEFLVHFPVQGSLLFVWGNEEERAICATLHEKVGGIVLDRMSLPLWQNVMALCDLVIAVDSSALHLCGTTKTPTLGLFGPTLPELFRPLGAHHQAIRAPCPRDVIFSKQCPFLRNCPTGECMRGISAEQMRKKTPEIGLRQRDIP